MLRRAIENALIPMKAKWAGYRLHGLWSPNGQNPGHEAGKESYHVRCNTPNLALEGEVLA
jgi:hypothetical protein